MGMLGTDQLVEALPPANDGEVEKALANLDIKLSAWAEAMRGARSALIPAGPAGSSLAPEFSYLDPQPVVQPAPPRPAAAPVETPAPVAFEPEAAPQPAPQMAPQVAPQPAPQPAPQMAPPGVSPPRPEAQPDPNEDLWARWKPETVEPDRPGAAGGADAWPQGSPAAPTPASMPEAPSPILKKGVQDRWGQGSGAWPSDSTTSADSSETSWPVAQGSEPAPILPSAEEPVAPVRPARTIPPVRPSASSEREEEQKLLAALDGEVAKRVRIARRFNPEADIQDLISAAQAEAEVSSSKQSWWRRKK